MTSKRSKLFWDLGVPLADAWRIYANAEKRLEIDNRPMATDEFDRHAKAAIDPVIGIFDGLKAAHKTWSANQKLEIDLKADLLDELFNNQLVATGYREAPTPSRMPVTIGADDFEDAEADWINSKILVRGIIYCRVRVTMPDAIKSNSSRDKARGRPGSGAVIRSALDKLVEENPGFCRLARKVACQKIRDHLGIQYETGNGLSDPNLARFICAKCKIRAISKPR